MTLDKNKVGIGLLLVVVTVAAIFSLTPRPLSTKRSNDAGGAKAFVDQHAGFVDQASCVSCHADHAEQWGHSDHALGMQRATEETVLGDFDDVDVVHFGMTSRLYRADGKFMVHTDNEDGVMTDFEISYTIGIRPLQQYLVEREGGHIQTLQLCWDTEKKSWFRLYDEPIRANDPLHWTGLNFRWNFMCADCHTTSLQKNYNVETHSYDTSWSHINVSCQACHGPGEAHVAWAGSHQKGAPYTDAGLDVTLSATNSHIEVEACARCHARRNHVDAPYRHGGAFADFYELSTLRENLYYPDGQIQDEVYVYGSFVQSKMYHKGVRCTDCHNPHSAETHVTGNALCVRCHQPTPPPTFPSLKAVDYDSPAHHFHEIGTPGAQCVNCHMDSKVYMGVDSRRDHSFRIPRPDLSTKLGTPNACASCHADKDRKWVLDAFTQRYPRYAGTGVYHFAESIAKGRAGDPSAEPELIAIAGDRGYPDIVRATAVELLVDYASQESLDQMIGSLKDPSELVRHAAVSGVDRLYPDDGNPYAQRQKLTWLAPLLLDETKLVRTGVARVLAGVPDAMIEGRLLAGLTQASGEFLNRQVIIQDRPESHMNMGVYHQAKGKLTDAEAAYLLAVKIDPLFHPARFNLSNLYNTQGKNQKALMVLTDIVTADPRNGQGWYSLGLLYAELKQQAQMLAALKKAATYLPQNARVHYNYGLACQNAAQPEAASAQFQMALQLEPQNLDFLYAAAINFLQQGNRRASTEFVQQMLIIDQRDERALNLMKNLQRSGPNARGK